jgi:hypothetical protein
MTPEDFRALTPLTYAHINPYGKFQIPPDLVVKSQAIDMAEVI